MKTTFLSVLAFCLQLDSVLSSSHRHDGALAHFESRYRSARRAARNASRASSPQIAKRSQCAFPTNAGLVAVTPGSANAGWAMSPDQSCVPNSWCPYACPVGQVMAQWNPAATSYPSPLSMDGGLFCDANGNIQKPFPNQPYCVGGSANIQVVDTTGKGVSFCQTILPGNEAMLIPTWVSGSSQLAIPDSSYWLGTSAHYYINPPGVTPQNGCIWGSSSNAVGNWAPYVAGGNTVAAGYTFIKLAWNPEYVGSSLAGSMPNFGVKIECDGPGCNGLPCAIDPSSNALNQVSGGQAFCVVTVPQGVTAKYTVFNAGNSGAEGAAASPAVQSSSAPQQQQQQQQSQPAASSPPPAAVQSSAPPPPKTTSVAPAAPTTQPASSSPSPSSSSSAAPTSLVAPSSTSPATTTLTTAPSSAPSSTSDSDAAPLSLTWSPILFLETSAGLSTITASSAPTSTSGPSTSSTSAPAQPSLSKTSNGIKFSRSNFGASAALVAFTYLLFF